MSNNTPPNNNGAATLVTGMAAAPSPSSAAAPTPSSSSSSSSRSGPPNYHRLEKLGKGSFATVYRAVHIETNQEAAIKDISQERLTLKLQENLESEISILKNHAHRNIVRLYDIERNDKHIYIILEYCRGGDLQRFIKHQPGARLGEGTAQHFMRHLAAGLKFLNDRNLVHRDIKPQNLLLTENSPRAVLKIADFGFARHLEGTSMAETLCGSPLYMAPEILSQNQYNAKADLWSVGAVLFEMVAGRPPFAAQNQVELLKVIKRPLQIPSDVELSRPCVALLQRLLKREPLERISFEDFFQDGFIDMKGSGILFSDAMGTAEEAPAPGAMTAQKDGSSSTSPPTSSSPSAAATPTRHVTMPESPFLGTVATSEASPDHQHQRTTTERLVRKEAEALSLINAANNSGGGRTSSSSSSSARNAMLPFQTKSNKSPIAASPNPRVNPFKPLAASPPGAVALSGGHGRSSSSSSSRRGSAGPSLGGSGVEATESLESDGFVIINTVARTTDPYPSSGSGGGGGGGAMTGYAYQQHAYPQYSHRLNPSPSFGAGGGGGPFAGLPGGMYLQGQQGGYGHGAVVTTTSSSSSSQVKSTDSVEGALRVLTYVESSTRRAILIASLGDAKAIAGLSLRRGGAKPGGLLDLPLVVHNILLQDGEEGTGGESGEEGSTTTTSTSTGSSSASVSADAEAKAGALLVDALVLYLKALSVVGTAIKALRQVIDVVQTHLGSQQQQPGGSSTGGAGHGSSIASSTSSGGRMAVWHHADSLEERKGVGSGTGGLSSGSLQDRIASLREWLELHFSIILDRAQECRSQMDKQQQQQQQQQGTGGGMDDSDAMGATLVTRSAEELLYKHALSLAKEGAVKELLGQWTRGLELYAQAKLMMEALLAEPLLPLEDQQTLERYVEEFQAREEELQRQCRQQEEEKTAAAAAVGGGGGAV